MQPKFNSLTPMLETHDMESTIGFYTEVLGFVTENYVRDMGWCLLQRDAVSIMFTLPNEHRDMPKSIMSGSLYINANDVGLIWENLKDRCNICYPIEDFEYGMREFAVYDNNGYLLQFGQEIW